MGGGKLGDVGSVSATVNDPVLIEREWFLALMAAVDDLAEAALEALLDPSAVLAAMEQLGQVLSRHDEAILA